MTTAIGDHLINPLKALHLSQFCAQHRYRLVSKLRHAFEPFDPCIRVEQGVDLVVHGPYQFTRNLMYRCGIVIGLGWVIFYGSVAVLVGFVVVWGNVAFLVVPWEEHKLETRFGEAYLRYKNSVPRWLGKRSR